MLFHVNTALFLPFKPSNFRYSAQIFVGHSTKNPPSFPASVFALPPKILHRFDGQSMEMQWSNLGLTITNRRREICIIIVKASEFSPPSRKFIFISAFHN